MMSRRNLLTFMLLLCGFLLAGMGRADSVQRDQPWGVGMRRTMDVYTVPASSPAPVIVMVHGGGWRIGDKDNAGLAEPKASHYNAMGYVFIAIDYPLLPEADPLTQAREVAHALAFIQQHAARWHGDGHRVVLMGHSAGAHIVSLLASSPELVRQAGAAPWLGTVALDSAALDVGRIMRGPHLPLYDQAFGKDPGYWSQVSPLARLDARPAPMLLVCSNLRLESCPQARAFAAKVVSLGGTVRVQPEELSHRDINITLGKPGAYTDAVDNFLRSLSRAMP
jgi:acetyl esterase/lipase